MDDLRRKLAPISSAAWHAIDDEARDQLRVILAGRHIADLTGPLGWDASAVGIGRVQAFTSTPYEGVQAGVRRVQRLIELRAPFELERAELDSLERGATTIDLEP